jgi:hypothetical protein
MSATAGIATADNFDVVCAQAEAFLHEALQAAGDQESTTATMVAALSVIVHAHLVAAAEHHGHTRAVPALSVAAERAGRLLQAVGDAAALRREGSPHSSWALTDHAGAHLRVLWTLVGDDGARYLEVERAQHTYVAALLDVLCHRTGLLGGLGHLDEATLDARTQLLADKPPAAEPTAVPPQACGATLELCGYAAARSRSGRTDVDDAVGPADAALWAWCALRLVVGAASTLSLALEGATGEPGWRGWGEAVEHAASGIRHTLGH